TQYVLLSIPTRLSSELSGRILDLLVGGRVGDTLGHDERHVGGRLAERLEHEAAGFAQEDAEARGRWRVHALDEAHQLLAHRVARSEEHTSELQSRGHLV